MPEYVFSATYKDYSKEKSTVSFNVASTATMANLATTISALNALSLGTPNLNNLSVVTKLSNASPTTPTARREKGLRFKYEDTTSFNTFIMTVPCADESLFTFIEGTDFVVLDDAGIVAAFVTAFEANAKSPDGGAVNVLTAEFVGRAN